MPTGDYFRPEDTIIMDRASPSPQFHTRRQSALACAFLLCIMRFIFRSLGFVLAWPFLIAAPQDDPGGRKEERWWGAWHAERPPEA